MKNQQMYAVEIKYEQKNNKIFINIFYYFIITNLKNTKI